MDGGGETPHPVLLTGAKKSNLRYLVSFELPMGFQKKKIIPGLSNARVVGERAVSTRALYSEPCALVNKPSGASAGASDLKY